MIKQYQKVWLLNFSDFKYPISIDKNLTTHHIHIFLFIVSALVNLTSNLQNMIHTILMLLINYILNHPFLFLYYVFDNF